MPYVLTAADLVRLARIDEASVKHPEDTLERYRRSGALRGTQISLDMRYLLLDVMEFLHKLRGPIAR